MLLPLHDTNPLKHIRFQYVTVGIIGVCVAVFFYQLSLGDRSERAFIFGFGAIPAVVFGIKTLPVELTQAPAVLSLVTSMFLHGGFMHLLGNMLFLWVLGDNVEDALGHRRFVVFYLLTGLIAALAHAGTDTASQIPMIGASGAISGVIGAYLMVHPKARIKTLVGYFIVSLPALLMLAGIGLDRTGFRFGARSPRAFRTSLWFVASTGAVVVITILVIIKLTGGTSGEYGITYRTQRRR
ncbi:MAG: hypothetical protein CFH02_00614, partial [Alphaproteobacteria bacterium MarineAlpha3_Bin1]